MLPRPSYSLSRPVDPRGSALLLLVVAAFAAGAATGLAPPPLLVGLEVEDDGGAFDPLDAAERARIEAMIAANIAELEGRQLLPKANAGSVLFDIPVRGTSAALGPGVTAIHLYVDHDLARPDALRDYTCGTRTYDLPTYNHGGTDFMTWPFPWLRMERGEVVIVAAADGVIVGKDDGNDDRSCDPYTDRPWNAVYVRHADGTVIWYGHMKRGTPTPKPVGAAVTAGEVLGVVGSSGRSGGPHLHFEVRDPQNLLLDPFAGPCNLTNQRSMWRQQPPYYDPAINLLSTHSGIPERPPCPATELAKFKSVFQPGETVVLAAYFRHQLAGQVTRLRLVQPDGATFTEWEAAATAPFFSRTAWYWEEALPADAPRGAWRLEAVHEGQRYSHSFAVGGCATGERLCLHGGRFLVEVDWRNQFTGAVGRGVALPSSDLAGFFAFDDPANVELMVKLLDFGPSVYLFYGQLTTLHFTLRVTDTRSGEVKTWSNGPGDCGAIDRSAFPGGALAGAAGAALDLTAAVHAAGECVEDGETLCLLDGRFRLRLAWRNQYSGASGSGRAQAMSRLTGSFSFDDPRNLEVLVKTLDFGDRVLVLYGSLSDLEYALEVTEVTSGRTKTYRNPAGTYCGGLDPRF